MTLPDWVRKWKTKNVEIHRRGDNYYAYIMSSVYDPVKKRSKKVTGEYLGKVTPDGIIPPKHKRAGDLKSIHEGGNIVLIDYFARDLIEPLKKEWPEKWQSLLSLAILKLAYKCPLKRMKFHYDTSVLPFLYPDAHISKNTITSLLREIGSDWYRQRRFFNSLCNSSGYMAIDLTHIFSNSVKLPFNEIGYNSDGIWREQLHLLLLWAMDKHHPTFLKLLPGSVNSAPALATAIQDAGLSNVVLVGDKGFYSESNLEILEAHNIEYIIALKRALKYLKYPAPSRYTANFIYRDTLQWWREYSINSRRVVTYLDKSVASEEERIFFERVRDGASDKRRYRDYRNRFGTLTLITNTGLSAEALYEHYKERKEIEYAFDALKNTIKSDKTWMQEIEASRGYFFITFIALYLYSRLLDHLKRKDLLHEYGVDDVLAYLSKIYVIHRDGKMIWSETPKQTRKLMKEIEIPITQKLGS